MYKGFKAAPKLIEAVKLNKPDAFLTALKYQIVSEKRDSFLKEIKEDYKSTYLNNAGFFKEKFVIYTQVDENGLKTYEYKNYKPATSSVELKLPLNKRELTDEAKALVEAGKVVPTLELFIEQELEKRMKDIDIDSLSTEDLINEGYAPFDLITTYIADLYHKKAEEAVAQKPDVTIYQQQRYNAKLELAKKYLETGDEEAKAMLSVFADKVDITVDTYANSIVESATAWTKELNKLQVLIDEYRISVKHVYKVNPMAAINILIEAHKVFDNPSIDAINAIFDKYTVK